MSSCLQKDVDHRLPPLSPALSATPLRCPSVNPLLFVEVRRGSVERGERIGRASKRGRTSNKPVHSRPSAAAEEKRAHGWSETGSLGPTV
jgi:hypothetical protein